MSTVQEPPFTAARSDAFEQAFRAGEELRDSVNEKVEEGRRGARELRRVATERFRKLKGSAGELFDTTEKKTLTVSTVAAGVGIGFLAGFLVGRAR